MREIKEKKPVRVRVIVSSGDRSYKGGVEFYAGESIRVGDEIIVELPDRVTLAEITAIELKNGKRGSEAVISEIETIWTREVEEVFVKISLHKGKYTESVKIKVPGEEVFRINETLRISGKPYRVIRIRTRDGRVLRSPFQEALAKEIVRIYAKYEI